MLIVKRNQIRVYWPQDIEILPACTQVTNLEKILLDLIFLLACKKKNLTHMHQLGIEPGSTAWKAAMLTTIPLTLA